MGEQITAEQLMEKRIFMMISRHDHEHRHPCQVDRNDSAPTTITPHIDRYPACM